MKRLIALTIFLILVIGYSKLICLQDFPALAASNENSPYGMNTALFWTIGEFFPENKWELAVGKMVQAGVKFNRTTINWRAISKNDSNPNNWDWGKHDRFIELLNKNGISPLGYFYFTPEFAWKYPNICNTARWNGRICAPKSDAWRDFIEKTVERYGCGPGGKCQIKYWEIWNEPNSNSIDKEACKCQKGEHLSLCGTIDDYFEMLRVAYEAIKTADPNATVVMAGLGQGSTGTGEFLDDLLAKKYRNKPCGDFFDVFNIHHYYGVSSTFLEAVKKGLDRVKQLRQKYGLSNKPIWVTELNRGDDNCIPISEAANNQIAAINVLLENGAQKVFWFKLEGSAEAECGMLGILQKDSFLEILVLYQAYQKMAGVISFSQGWNQIVWPTAASKKASDIPTECPIAVSKENFWFTPFVENFGGVNFDFEKDKTYFIKCNQAVTWNL